MVTITDSRNRQVKIGVWEALTSGGRTIRQPRRTKSLVWFGLQSAVNSAPIGFRLIQAS